VVDFEQISNGKIYIIKSGEFRIENENHIYTIPPEMNNKVVMILKKLNSKKILGLVGNKKLEIPIVAIKKL